MSRTVQIQGDRANFPGKACVHCLRPADHAVDIVKVKGHGVRKIAVPFCDRCIALRQARSRRQVLFVRAAAVNTALLSLAVAVWVYAFVTSEFALQGAENSLWGLLLAALAALIVLGIMRLILRPWSWCFRSAETKAALKAVAIRDFDWETMTLDFANDEYAERFAQVNRPPSKTEMEA